MRLSIISVAAALPLALTACGTDDDPTVASDTDLDPGMIDDNPPQTQESVADLATADGTAAGQALVAAYGDGITLALNVRNLPPGEHGAHIHETGTCEPPSFESAGGHWNPTGQEHGLDDPDGPHAGDMPNITVSDDGTGTLSFELQGGASYAALMDADGAAIVIHSGQDDQMSDPAGDSGERIACGVFTAN